MSPLARALESMAVFRRLASSGPMDIESLARVLGRGDRTVRRCLAELRAAGVPVEEVPSPDGSPRKFFSIHPPADLSAVRLDALDALALRVLLAQARLTPGEPFADEVSALEHKLAGLIDPAWQPLYERLDGLVVARPRMAASNSVDPDVTETLLDAAHHRQLCDVRYLAWDGAERNYPIGPLALHRSDDGRHYLAAWVPDRQATRLFSMARFREVRRRRDHFDPPPSFEPASFFATSFGLFHGDPVRLVVQFDASVSRSIKERAAHPSQTVTERPDGGLDVTIEAEGRQELLAWVLSYGEFAEVIEPVEMRVEISRRLTGALQRYAGLTGPDETSQRPTTASARMNTSE